VAVLGKTPAGNCPRRSAALDRTAGRGLCCGAMTNALVSVGVGLLVAAGAADFWSPGTGVRGVPAVVLVVLAAAGAALVTAGVLRRLDHQD